ncbi:MAG TPA: NUDIX domain-containing protein [Gemmatimonadaceae bacterium]|nr:NUDIX domain-containing protein [Gemmatimonadaceae bacterium]
MTAPIRVLAAVVARGERYLVCQRPAHKRHGGLWEFPGGKLEPGEGHALAAARELHEELGVAVTHVGTELFGVADPGSPFHIAFVPVAIAGEPACLEHSALLWATPDELRALALAPSDRRFVEEVLLARGDGATVAGGG